jgi:endonuclease/exonuclease/phosphatase family metal-dependent hydrolase
VARHIDKRPRAGGERPAVDDVAREFGLSVVYAPSMRNGAGVKEDRGNAILTTLPLTGALALELPVARQRRVAVASQVRGRSSDGEPWDLLLLSVHLENRPARGVTGVGERAAQAQWLLGALPPAGARVLGGDLNTWVRGDDERAFTDLRQHFAQTLAAPASFTHASHWLVRGQLDFILADVPGGRMSGYARATSSFGSDHYPVFAWIHLP